MPVFFIGFLGCSQSSDDMLEAAVNQRAIVSASGDRTSFVLTDAPDTADISALSDPSFLEKTNFWWIRIDMPSDSDTLVDSPSGFQGDLSQNIDVVFTHNYKGVCDPSADVPSICWLREHYTAGETGLKGVTSIKTVNGNLELYYSVDWQGITDRFESEPSWFHHIVEGGGVAKIEEGTQ